MVPPKIKSHKTQPFEMGLKFSFHRFRKLRLYVAWLFTIALAIYARSTERGFWIGAPVILVGEAIRIWAHGYLKKAKELATHGPYAFVRNPLYIGNFLIGFGFCLIIWNPIIGVVYPIGFFLVYWVTVRGEEQRLAFSFGDAYANYLQNVPRFLPRLVPYKDRTNGTFTFHRAWEHGECITILASLASFLLLYLRQELYQRHRPLSAVSPGLWVLIIGVEILLCGATALRWLKGRRQARGPAS